MEISVNLIFLAAGLFQGVVILLSLWKNHEQTIFSWFLIGFLLLLMFQVFLYPFNKTLVEDIVPMILYRLGYKVPLLISPFGYLYIKYTLYWRSTLGLRDSLLFVPFLYLFSLLVAFHLFQEHWVAVLYPNVYVDLVVQVAMHAYCMISAHRIIKGFTTKRFALVWLRKFLFATSIVGAIIIVVLKVMFFLPPDYYWIRLALLALPMFIYWITYKSLSHVLRLEPERPKRVTVRPPRVVVYPSTIGNLMHSGLSESHAIELEKRLLNHMSVDKPYLNTGLKIEEVAETLKIPVHHLYQVLEDRIKKRFNDLVNEYRIEAAKKMLESRRFTGWMIAAISAECGFISLSTFNSAFKKLVGMTPSAYRKSKRVVKKKI